MSEQTLTIGKLPFGYEEEVLEALERLGLRSPVAWTRYAGASHELCLMNLATVVFFGDHVARLEGLPSSAARGDRSRFKNLPYWETSVWLPFRFAVPKEPPGALGEPLFLGSAPGLLDELDEVRRLSDERLGEAPRGYEAMRADIDAFRKLRDFELTDDGDCLRWVWRCLWDGAELAVRESAPMMLWG